ncbi:MAG TPA: inorganic diphosphatase [Nitrososphaeraceae archaeon]
MEDTLFEVNIIIEIPKNSNIKYEMEVKTGIIIVDRILAVKMIYPCNYGYIINTREQDGDHMDAFVLGNYSLTPGSIIRSRPVGVLLSQDQEGTDSKIIAVPATKVDPSFSNIADIEDMPTHMRSKLQHFVEHHKDLEKGKYVKILGWRGKQVAKKLILEASERYKSKR